MSGVTPAVMAALKGEPTPTAKVEPTDPEELSEEIVDDEELEAEDAEEETEESDEEATEEDPEAELPENIKNILTKNRKELRETKAKLAKAEKDLAKAQEANPDAAIVAEAQAFKGLYLNTSAKAQLAEAGATAGLDRLAKLIDFDSVEVDADGSVSGLDDQIASLKEDFPELFAAKKTPKPVKTTARGDAAPRPAPEPKKTSAQKIAGLLGA